MKNLLFACICVLLSAQVNAALIDRGGGLIYDSVLDITWLQDARFCRTNPTNSACIAGNADVFSGSMTRAGADTYAEELIFGGGDNWRLSKATPINGVSFDWTPSYDATTDHGYADAQGWVDDFGIPSNELGHLFYVSLGNLGRCAPDSPTPPGNNMHDCDVQAGYGPENTGPFENLEGYYYWQDADTGDQYEKAFYVGYGYSAHGSASSLLAWAVHDGDLAVIPIPAATWLFLSGLAGLVLVKRRAAPRG